MGELIFTFSYGGALIIAGILVKTMTSKPGSMKNEKKEVSKQGRVI